jgi:myo-inositol-1(or 4)-monophosphatase
VAAHFAWQRILSKCKNEVIKEIEPLLKTLNQPQPDLGIGAGGDQLSQVDLKAERAIINVLKENGVSFTLISEESGIEEFGSAPTECYVTVDPIDGSTNLTRGIPFYATSIAVSSEPTLSSVHSALVTDLYHNVTYSGQKRGGALRNGRKICPSTLQTLEEAVVGADLNTYKVEAVAPRLTALIKEAKHVRHFGANALELCYVADGTIDAFIDIRGKLRTTDIAAASLILKETGAKITTPEGQPLSATLDPKERLSFVAAANSRIHKIILELVNSRKETSC